MDIILSPTPRSRHYIGTSVHINSIMSSFQFTKSNNVRTATTLHFATQNICKWLKKSLDSTILSSTYILCSYEKKKRKKKSICNNAKRIESGTAAEYNKKNTGKRPQGIQDSLIFPHQGITTFQRQKGIIPTLHMS